MKTTAQGLKKLSSAIKKRWGIFEFLEALGNVIKHNTAQRKPVGIRLSRQGLLYARFGFLGVLSKEEAFRDALLSMQKNKKNE